MIAKPSKSALKREYLALQALGEQLIELTTDQLLSIGLEENLLDAIRGGEVDEGTWRDAPAEGN